MSTPTPRTDSVYLAHRHWGNEYEATEAIEDLRDLARTLERELAAERARLDWFANYGDTCWHDQTMGVLRGEDGAEFYADSFRAAIDAAMKEGAP